MKIAHRIFLVFCLALTFYSTQVNAADLDKPAPKTTRRLWIPFDHGKPQEGSFLLQYEFGSLFNRQLPTVFVITDGQRIPDRPALLQEEIFGTAMNVVSISQRGTSIELQGRLQTPEGNIDWIKAYDLLQAEQWIEDIEAVRRDLLGNAQVHLYGREGGAFLIHQYLTRYGAHVSRVFSLAAITPYLSAGLMNKPKEAAGQSEDTGEAQRTSREIKGTTAAQVRIFELNLPTAMLRAQQEATSKSQTQTASTMAHPLFKLLQEGKIQAPTMEFTIAAGFETEVLVLAGIQDRRTDPHCQASLAARYPQGNLLLIENDNPTFRILESSELYATLVQSFLHNGYQSDALMRVLRDLKTRGGKK
jgi:pimeloyl-ACP methyl ester carboxylesterase